MGFGSGLIRLHILHHSNEGNQQHQPEFDVQALLPIVSWITFQYSFTFFFWHFCLYRLSPTMIVIQLFNRYLYHIIVDTYIYICYIPKLPYLHTFFHSDYAMFCQFFLQCPSPAPCWRGWLDLGRGRCRLADALPRCRKKSPATWRVFLVCPSGSAVNFWWKPGLRVVITLW